MRKTSISWKYVKIKILLCLWKCKYFQSLHNWNYNEGVKTCSPLNRSLPSTSYAELQLQDNCFKRENKLSNECCRFFSTAIPQHNKMSRLLHLFLIHQGKTKHFFIRLKMQLILCCSYGSSGYDIQRGNMQTKVTNKL